MVEPITRAQAARVAATASPERQAQLYQAAKLEIRDKPGGQIAEVSTLLESRMVCVSEGRHAHRLANGLIHSDRDAEITCTPP